MNTRTIYYIDENEDFLNDEVVLALSRTLDQNLRTFCKTVIANYAMMNIDVVNVVDLDDLIQLKKAAIKGRSNSRDSEDLSFLEKLKNKKQSEKK